MADVVVFGDVNVDIIAHFPSFPVRGGDAFATKTEFHSGGSAANTALALAQLRVQTLLIARLGIDPWAAMARERLAAAGVDMSGVQLDTAKTSGLMYVVVNPGGERTILGDRGANTKVDRHLIEENWIQEAKRLHLSGYALLAEPQRSSALWTLETAQRHGVAISLDPGTVADPRVMEQVRDLLPVVDISFPTLAEARQLTGRTAPRECVQALLEKGCRVVALKLGAEGCLVGSDDGLQSVPAFSVEAQDSTGAGDSFAAGFLAALLGGMDLHQAAILGNAMGALATSQTGATVPVRALGDIVDLIQGGRVGMAGLPEGSPSGEPLLAFLHQILSEYEED
jgi:ribokinase